MRYVDCILIYKLQAYQYGRIAIRPYRPTILAYCYTPLPSYHPSVLQYAPTILIFKPDKLLSHHIVIRNVIVLDFAGTDKNIADLQADAGGIIVV